MTDIFAKFRMICQINSQKSFRIGHYTDGNSEWGIFTGYGFLLRLVLYTGEFRALLSEFVMCSYLVIMSIVLGIMKCMYVHVYIHDVYMYMYVYAHCM